MTYDKKWSVGLLKYLHQGKSKLSEIEGIQLNYSWQD